MEAIYTSLLPPGCLSHNLALDVFSTNVYHLYSVWQPEATLAAFKNSHEYHMLKGSFLTLGDYHSTTLGRMSDVHLFEITETDH